MYMTYELKTMLIHGDTLQELQDETAKTLVKLQDQKCVIRTLHVVDVNNHDPKDITYVQVIDYAKPIKDFNEYKS